MAVVADVFVVVGCLLFEIYWRNGSSLKTKNPLVHVTHSNASEYHVHAYTKNEYAVLLAY